MTKRNVKNGTPDHSRPEMCLTCRNATVARGYADSQRYLRCSEFGWIRFPIYECSQYEHKLAISLYEMNKMATLIEPTKDGLGFHGRKLTREEWHE